MEEWPKEGTELAPAKGAASQTIRGTQSFVRVMQWCWQHPSVTALEVLWRWTFGAIALSLLYRRGTGVLSAVTGGANSLASLGLDQLTVTDPMAAAGKLAAALGLLLPPALHIAVWLAPLLLVLWLAISTVGRTMVLRRVDRTMRVRPLTVAMLQLIRIVALGGSLALWFLLVRWAGKVAISDPLVSGGQPALVEYFAIVIVGTLALFCSWAVASWGLSLAPILAMQGTGRGVNESLQASFRRGPIRLKLVEINLVMGIVKIALVVLAMVFSACPLPFQSVITPEFLVNWTVGVLVLYLLASDFFQVARLMAYLELWRFYADQGPVHSDPH